MFCKLNKKGWKKNKISLNYKLVNTVFSFIKNIVFGVFFTYHLFFKSTFFLYIGGKNIKRI